MEINIKSNVKWRAKAGSALVYFQKFLETQFAVFLLNLALGIKHTNKISKNEEKCKRSFFDQAFFEIPSKKPTKISIFLL
jgi:hypothetical protein